MALLALLIDRNPQCVLEIGTFNGNTTRLMALNLPGTVFHTVDLPEDYNAASDSEKIQKDDFHLIARRKVGSAFHADPSITNVVQHFGDTASWDFRPAAEAAFFFIDGSHTYEYIRNDTRKSCTPRAATCHHSLA